MMTASIQGRPTAAYFDCAPTVPHPLSAVTSRLAAAGVSLTASGASAPALSAADVVLATGTRRLGRDTLDTLDRCCGIVSLSTGLDHVDVDAAESLGIPVCNVAGYATDDVATHAILLVLAALRRLLPVAAACAGGRWDVDEIVAPIRRLTRQTVGVVGAGRIGRRVAENAAGLGFRVIAHDPEPARGAPGAVSLVALEALLATSDAVVLCASSTGGNRHLIDASALAMMRSGSVLVNVARGALVDERALADAIRDGQLAGAALDVREHEPCDPATDPLRGLPNVVLTPHIGAASIEARADLARAAAATIVELLVTAGRLTGERGRAASTYGQGSAA